MRIMVVGGFGYLGSILVDLLTNDGHEVFVNDIKLWDNDTSKDIRFKQVLPYGGSHDWDCTIWCANIDVQNFYSAEVLKLFLLRQKQIFRHYMESSKLFINCSSYQTEYKELQNSPMIGYLKELEGMVDVIETAYNFRTPSLHGPSPRMRWDTIANQIMFDLIMSTEKIVLIADDCLIDIPFCNVFEYAEMIKGFVVKQENGKPYEKYYTELYTLLELAHILAIKTEGNVKVIAKQLVRNEWNNWGKITNPKLSILDSFRDINKNLERGNLPDFTNDRYSNESMVRNMLSSYNLVKTLEIT